MSSQNRRNIPHPVLTPGGGDYSQETTFQAEVKTVLRNAESETLQIPVLFTLTDPNLKALISKRHAKYSVVVDCPVTHIRETRDTSEDSLLINLNQQDFRKRAEILPYIIATRHLQNYCSERWLPWLKAALPQGIEIPQGSILAISETSTFNPEQSTDTQSCIQLVAQDGMDSGRWKISLEKDLIHILVSPGDKGIIDTIREDDEQQQKLWPSIYQSAVELAVRKHLQDEHREKTWAETIKRKLEEKGLETEDMEILEEHSLSYAQDIMEGTLHRITEIRRP